MKITDYMHHRIGVRKCQLVLNQFMDPEEAEAQAVAEIKAAEKLNPTPADFKWRPMSKAEARRAANEVRAILLRDLEVELEDVTADTTDEQLEALVKELGFS